MSSTARLRRIAAGQGTPGHSIDQARDAAAKGLLLGVVTLEEPGLMLNPFNRELQPMQMILYCTNASLWTTGDIPRKMPGLLAGGDPL